MIETEAERAHSRRIGSSFVGMVTGGGIVASGAVLLAIGVPKNVDATAIDILAGFSMVAGGIQIVSNLISLFVTTPMERLFEAYAPIAIDKDVPASDRVRKGEVLLASMAEAERGRRNTEAVSGLVGGVIYAGLTVFIAADDQLYFIPPANGVYYTDQDKATNALFRGAFALGFGLGAASAIGQAIASWVWERGAAEVAWEHWQASHGSVTVHTESKVQVRPLLAPVVGGGVGGVSLRF